MAIAFGAALGTNFAGGGGTSVALTTTGTVPAGGKVIVCVGWFESTATCSVAGGSLSWTQDGFYQNTGDANQRVGIFSADAPAGLASSTVLTATFTASAFTNMICGCYATGLATASYQDGTVQGATGSLLVTPWNTGTLNTTNADDFLIGAGWLDFQTITSTTTAPFVEFADFQNTTDTNTMTAFYRVVAATGAYQAAGNWSAGGSKWVMALVGYKGASAAATQIPVVRHALGGGRW